MAHYAFLDDNNIVIEIITGLDEDKIQIDLDGSVVGGSSEAWEQFYSAKRNGLTCKRTSYNGKIRGKYAIIGDYYDEVNDVFVSPVVEEVDNAN